MILKRDCRKIPWRNILSGIEELEVQMKIQC